MGKKRKVTTGVKTISQSQPVGKPGVMSATDTTVRPNIMPAIIVLICSFLAFLPSLYNQYVTWDDPEFIYQNPLVVNISGANFFTTLRQIFTTTTVGAYAPLTVLSFAIEKMVFGLDNPFYLHLDNLLLHLLCVYLVFRICQGLKLPATICFVTALLFGLHPMRVESVAWLTERKDVLYGAFYLGGMLMYIRYITEGKLKKHLRLVYIFFILSLFSKIQAVAFPLSLLLIDYFLHDKLDRKLVISKLPYFLLSLIFGLAGVYLLKSEAILAEGINLNLFERLLLATYTIVIYLVKSLVPYQMITIYSYPSKLGAEVYASVLIIPVIIFILSRAWKSGNKLVVFGLLFFLLNVFLVLQIVIAGQGFMADRYTYLPYMGLFMIFAYLFHKLELSYPLRQQAMRIGGGIYLALLALITYNQCKVWENGGTLWTHVLENDKDVSTAYVNRALYYYQTSAFAKALQDYDQAIKMERTNAELYESRGKMYFDLSGQDQSLTAKAFADFNKAIELKKNVPAFYANRASAHGKMGNLDSALADVNKSISLDAGYADAYYTRYLIYRNQNRLAESIKDGEKFLSLSAENPALRAELDNMRRYLQSGR